MKLLKLELPNGYKMLQPGFEINFLAKTRIDRDSPNRDLCYLAESLPYPIETFFVGKNSSGKTTVLEAISLALELLAHGRIRSGAFAVGESFELRILFFAESTVYRYEGSFVRPDRIGSEFMEIAGERLFRSAMKAHYKKDLSNAVFREVPGFEKNIGGDTSRLPHLGKGKEVGLFLPATDAWYAHGFGSFLDSLRPSFDHDTLMRLVRLFDDSVEYVKPYLEGNGRQSGYAFKRVGREEIVVEDAFLDAHLSEGTKRGVTLFGYAMLLFRHGGHLVIDEIEGSFHKNLIGNLVLMFNDPAINKGKATLICSTHYSELLDFTSRCDNINILHRDGCLIGLKNMAKDYGVRTELRHSAQFDENVFDNLLNYDRLMDLKERLRQP